ncbi:hypothetical protein D3C76_1131180 [compost metagenome]
MTAAGSEPDCCLITSTPARCPHTSSCSIAPARNVSPAANSTFLPSCLKRCAILPIVVVFPTPLTPTNNITVIPFSFIFREISSSPRRSSISFCDKIGCNSKAFSILCFFTSTRNSSIKVMTVFTPTSAPIRISSSSS